MSNYRFTKHAMTRMSQRGVRNENIRHVLDFGTKVGVERCPRTGASFDIYLMRRADADREIDDLKDQINWIERMRKLKVMNGGNANREISTLKHKIRRFERLKGLKIVMEGGEIITCYWPSVAYQKRARRGGRAV